MALSLAVIIIIPMILLNSSFIIGDIFHPIKTKNEQISGRVLGVSEEADRNISQALMASKDGVVDNVVKTIETIKTMKDSYVSRIYNDDDIYTLPENKDKGPKPVVNFKEIEMKSEISCAVDVETDKIIYNKNDNQKVPIASISKLMTALVFLDQNSDWEAIYSMQRDDRREGGKIYLYLGEQVTVRDLFYLSLVGSANTATIALVHSTGFSEEEFVQKMNEKARELGLINTSFEDATGLSSHNISTAFEVAQIAKNALAKPEIDEATLKSEYIFKTLAGKEKRAYTTDYLLENFPENGIKILGGKTGYTDLAQYCFVGKFTDKNNHEIITVVLGSGTKNSRFYETRELAEWAYQNYVWN